MERVVSLASQKAVVIFGFSSCDMCHAMKTLLRGMGCDPVVHELDRDPMGKEMAKSLERLIGHSNPLPVIFVGGKLAGSTDRILSLHLAGDLQPLLRQARAIWL